MGFAMRLSTNTLHLAPKKSPIRVNQQWIHLLCLIIGYRLASPPFFYLRMLLQSGISLDIV